MAVNDNIKLLENLRQGFRRTVPWNKYRSEIRIEPKIDNLDCIIDPTFKNIHRLSVLSLNNTRILKVILRITCHQSNSKILMH